MLTSAIAAQFADELTELHEGSVSLFVTLPVFRALALSQQCAEVLARFEAMIGEHLAYLDGIFCDVLVRRDRRDGELTRLLFRSLRTLRARQASEERDLDIIRTVEQAQLFLMGSCSFALSFARQAQVSRSEQVLVDSLRRIRSLALLLKSAEAFMIRASQRTAALL